MPKRHPGPYPLVPAPPSRSREQIVSIRRGGSNVPLGEPTEPLLTCLSQRVVTGRRSWTPTDAGKLPNVHSA
jgi:hypothetical protein